jgi:type IV secretory pathway TrbF-like protein
VTAVARSPLHPIGYEFHESARRQFVELYGSSLVMNTYLKIALLGMTLVAFGLIYLNLRTSQALRSTRPLVIRIDEIGRATPVPGAALEYHPQAAELKYFLVQFVTDHYARIRATVKDSYARSLYFLDARLADATIDANRKSKLIERFLTESSEEIDVLVKNVALEDLRQPPYRATVDFDKIYYARDHVELRREAYVGQFVFEVKDRVPNAVIPINPLGLTITYFREDQAFVAGHD